MPFAVETLMPLVAGVPLSVSQVVELLRQNAIALDGLAYRDMPLFDSMASNPSYDAHPSGDFLLGRWSLKYISGLTSLIVTGTASGSTGGLSISINSVLVASVTLAGIWTETISIASGYGAGDLLLIDVYTSGNTNKTSKIVVHDIYATPLSLSGWTAPPTFTGGYAPDKLQILADDCDWLHRRMNMVPMLPTLAHYFRNGRNDLGNSGSGAGIITQYTGSVLRPAANSILRIAGWANILTNLTERIKVYLGGSLAYTGTTWTPGGYEINVPIDISSIAVGTRAELRIQSEVLSVANNLGEDSRYSFITLQTEAGGAGYPAQTPPAPILPRPANTSATTLNAALNAIGAMLTATKTTIEASTAFTRIRACRRVYGYDQHDWSKFTRAHPHRFKRRGDVLDVTGKGPLILGYGNQIMETDDDGHRTYAYTFEHEESLTDSNLVETKTIYLDNFAGLEVGMPYHIFGADYAAERLF